jgi:hypothetical protein
VAPSFPLQKLRDILGVHHSSQQQTASTKFKDAPIVVGEKVLHDALNYSIVQNFMTKTKQRLELYHTDD